MKLITAVIKPFKLGAKDSDDLGASRAGKPHSMLCRSNFILGSAAKLRFTEPGA